MSAIETAQRMVRWMINNESRGPGDRENAMRRLSKRYDIKHGTLWSLVYRPPSDMRISVFEKIANAFENERKRQLALIEQEREMVDTDTVLGALLVRASASILGADSVPEEGDISKERPDEKTKGATADKRH